MVVVVDCGPIITRFIDVGVVVVVVDDDSYIKLAIKYSSAIKTIIRKAVVAEYGVH